MVVTADTISIFYILCSSGFKLHCRFGFYAASGTHPAMLSQTDVYERKFIINVVHFRCSAPLYGLILHKLLPCHMPLVANSEAYRPGISRIQHHLLERINPSTSFDRRQDSVIVSEFLRPADVTVKSTPNDAMMLESLANCELATTWSTAILAQLPVPHGHRSNRREKPQQY